MLLSIMVWQANPSRLKILMGHLYCSTLHVLPLSPVSRSEQPQAKLGRWVLSFVWLSTVSQMGTKVKSSSYGFSIRKKSSDGKNADWSAATFIQVHLIGQL